MAGTGSTPNRTNAVNTRLTKDPDGNIVAYPHKVHTATGTTVKTTIATSGNVVIKSIRVAVIGPVDSTFEIVKGDGTTSYAAPSGPHVFECDSLGGWQEDIVCDTGATIVTTSAANGARIRVNYIT